MTFFDIAKPMAERGEPVIRLRPRSKIAADSNWPELATTDLETLFKWSLESPEAGCASVAKAQIGGVWFWEVDNPLAVQRMEAETGKKITNAFRVRSSPGRGHYHFLQTPASIAMGNIAQGFVKGADWSARVHDQYVVAPGSLHVRTGLPYEIVSDHPLSPAPDWLVQWLVLQKVEAKPAADSEDGPIISGSRNSTLASVAGKMRYVGMKYEEIESVLLRMNSERCQPPLPIDEVKTIAASISRYKVGVAEPEVIVGKPPAAVEPLDVVVIPPVKYPRFPAWVMSGTSVFKGLIEPICSVNSRYAEYLFLPAIAILLNYLGTRVQIGAGGIIPSLFMVLIGRKGRTHKSSSVQDAIDYFKYAGVLESGGPNIKNAQGKTLVWSIGSPEGFGIELQRTNCKSGLLVFDELASLVGKASIEGSSLVPSLLTMYESKLFQNVIKSKKDSFLMEPGTYCASLIACTTDKNFHKLWSKMAGDSSGLDERFFFLYQPETWIDKKPYAFVQTRQNAAETRRLIDKAIAQGVYNIAKSSPLAESMKGKDGNTSREEIRARKFALYFAVDMGLDELDEECIERGLALVRYEKEVKKWLQTFEADTRDGQILQEIMRHLHRNGGTMPVRELERVMHPQRLGLDLWNKVYYSMIKSGWAREEGVGGKGDPKKIVLLRTIEDEDDD